jgi:transposase InsO family protein
MALSRQIYYLEALPIERELEFKQSVQDVRLKEIATDLEYSENGRSDKFALVDSLVYKKGTDRSRFAIPESMVNNIIRRYHDEQAHCGLDKTFHGINSSYWFPSMRKRIRDYIDNCVICLMTDSSTNKLEGQLQSDHSPKFPFQRIHIDHFDPFQETKDGYKFIFSVVDAFTRFTWLFPTKTTSAREVINHLKFLFNIFGNPEELISDRGSAFTSYKFSTFIDELKIKIRKVAVASPWANGIVERVNRFLKSSLIKSVDFQGNWKDSLYIIQYTVNNTINSSVESSPSKLLLGYEQRNHSDKELKTHIDCLLQIESDLAKEREVARDTAFQANKKLREYNKAYYDGRHKRPSIYKTGDLVLVRNLQAKTGVNSKLKPNYKGPYVVSKVLDNNRYVIKDVSGFNITQKPYNTILSSDKMKPWIKSKPILPSKINFT